VSSPRPRKLPVPAPWQPPVRAALADLATRLELPPGDLAVTLVEETSWTEPPRAAATSAAQEKVARHGLSIWLMARGRTHRYRSDEHGAVVPLDPLPS
jgi:hypothetical protein